MQQIDNLLFAKKFTSPKLAFCSQSKLKSGAHNKGLNSVQQWSFKFVVSKNIDDSIEL